MHTTRRSIPFFLILFFIGFSLCLNSCDSTEKTDENNTGQTNAENVAEDGNTGNDNSEGSSGDEGDTGNDNSEGNSGATDGSGNDNTSDPGNDNGEKTGNDNPGRATDCELKVSFISRGGGINSTARDEFETFIKEYEKSHGLTLTHEIKPWGREGERDYCFTLEGMDGKKRKEFVTELRTQFGDKDRVFIEGAGDEQE